MGGLEQYESRVAEAEALIARGPDVITDLLAHSNYEWAAQNCRVTAEAYVDLGLLHWRRGIARSSSRTSWARASPRPEPPSWPQRHDEAETAWSMATVHLQLFTCKWALE